MGMAVCHPQAFAICSMIQYISFPALGEPPWIHRILSQHRIANAAFRNSQVLNPNIKFGDQLTKVHCTSKVLANTYVRT